MRKAINVRPEYFSENGFGAPLANEISLHTAAGCPTAKAIRTDWKATYVRAGLSCAIVDAEKWTISRRLRHAIINWDRKQIPFPGKFYLTMREEHQ